MKSVCIAVFVVVAALGLSACMGDEMGYSPSYGWLQGGYAPQRTVQETLVHAPYVVSGRPPLHHTPEAPMSGVFGAGGLLTGEGSGLILMLLALPFVILGLNTAG